MKVVMIGDSDQRQKQNYNDLWEAIWRRRNLVLCNGAPPPPLQPRPMHHHHKHSPKSRLLSRGIGTRMVRTKTLRAGPDFEGSDLNIKEF